MIRIRTFDGKVSLPSLDVTTGSNRVAAEEAASRGKTYGWDDVSVNFGDGSRAMRGEELRAWVERHYPELVA